MDIAQYRHPIIGAAFFIAAWYAYSGELPFLLENSKWLAVGACIVGLFVYYDSYMKKPTKQKAKDADEEMFKID